MNGISPIRSRLQSEDYSRTKSCPPFNHEARPARWAAPLANKSRERAQAFLVSFLLAWTNQVSAADPAPVQSPGLTERATSRLAQIDVTVSGQRASIEGLTAADFEVRLNDKLLPDLLVDDFCSQSSMTDSPTASAPQAGDTTHPERVRTSTANYLFYFDMPHLTQAGRQNAIESARAMLPTLLAGGRKAMIVANAAALKTIVPLTSDEAKLRAALSMLLTDQSTFDPYATLEQRRMADIIGEIGSAPSPRPRETGMNPNMGGLGAALRLARLYAAEERWRQERDLRRLSMVLGRFADLEPPKLVLYFADTMRQNAGEHYLSYFGSTSQLDSNGKPVADSAAIGLDAATGAVPLDRVMNDAAALGIRFYTIEGQGMAFEGSPIEARGSASNARGGSASNQATPVVNSQHVRDAQNTLVSLAAETGGRAFLNGVSPTRMSAQIAGDLSCVYLISFDPRGLAVDTPLAVSVKTKRQNVKTAVRGRLVIQSESARLTGRVMSAFASPDAPPEGSNAGVHVGVIPISYDAGKFKARVQVSLAGSAIPTTTWDVGASVVSRGAIRQDASGRIQVTLPKTPIVFEKDMEFAPGEYEIVAVAHETRTDTVLSTEIHGSWPTLDDARASLGPIAVSQRWVGGFLRNGEKETQGAVAVTKETPLRTDVPTAVIAFVCRAQDQKRPLRVVRTIIGETETPVGASDLDLSTEHCAQVVDLIPPKLLGAGRYRFVVAVSSDGEELTRGETAMMVPEPAPVAAAAPPASAP